MSIKLMSHIWENGPPNQSERFVMLALADYANDEGKCWPSIKGLCQKTCLKERGIQTIIRRLEACGWLDIIPGGGRKNCNIYHLKTPHMTAKTPHDMHPLIKETPHMDAETPHITAINPAPYAPEPSLTINREPSKCSMRAKSRLPENWALSDADYKFALSKKIHPNDIKEMKNEFHAYWTDRTDAAGKKSERGWAQCWRSHITRNGWRYIKNRQMAFRQNSGSSGFGGGLAGELARRRAGSPH